jgi:uncharacterized protein (TIRG00374 family)
MRRYVFTAVIFGVWIVGFWLASDVTGQNLISGLTKAPLWSILAGFGFYLLATGTGIYTLYRCLKYVELKPPKKAVAKAWIFGSFVDNMAPTVTPIGEAAMAYFLEKFYRISYTKSLAAIGLYVSSWGISVSLFSTIAVILVQYFVGIPGEFILPIVIILAFFITITIGWLVFITKKSLMRSILCKIMSLYNRVYNKIRRRKVTFEKCIFDMEFERSYSSLGAVMKSKKHIFGSVLMLGLPQLAHVLCVYVLLLGFGVQIPFFNVLLIHIVASVAGLISFIPSGLGVYEIVSSSALAAGISGEIAIGAIFIYRLIFVWTTNLLGGAIGVMQGVGEITKSQPHLSNVAQ